MANISSSNSLGERVPKLRFPGFEGGWVCEKLSDFTERVTRKNTNNETELPLTIYLRFNKTFRPICNGCFVNTIYMFYIEKTQHRLC